MAGNQMPVLTLDVNEDQIKRLEAIFEKYQNALKIGPGGFPMRIPDQSGSRSRGANLPAPANSGKNGAGAAGRQRDEKGRFIGSGKSTDAFVSNYKITGETMFDKYLNSLGKNAQATLKTYKQINSTLYQTNSRLKTLFKTTVSWGSKIAALGSVGAFGYGYMASKVAAQYSVAQGLGMTTAQMQAARSTYSPYISGTSELVQHLANAQNNPNDPNYSGLMALGINPKDGAAKNLPKLMSAIASLVKQYKGSGLTQGVINGWGAGFVDVATANQIAANLDKIPQLNERFATNTKLLGAYLTPAMQADYQDTASNLMVNGYRISNSWQAAVASLNPLISSTSDSVTSSIEGFLNGGNFKKVLTFVSGGLEKLGKWLNSEQFQRDLDDFSRAVSKVVKMFWSFVKWLGGDERKAQSGADNNDSFLGNVKNTVSEHPGLFGALGLMLGGQKALKWGARLALRHPTVLAATAYGSYAYSDRENIASATRSSWDYAKRNTGDMLRWMGVDTDIGRKQYIVHGTPDVAMDIPGVPRTLADRNNNPGNLRPVGGGGFRTFGSALDGWSAMRKQLMMYYNGTSRAAGFKKLRTIEDIINRWAPSGDNNNPQEYARQVAKWMGVSLNEVLDLNNPSTMASLMQAMARKEGYSAWGSNLAYVAAGGGKNDVQIQIQQKPGSDILAQLAGTAWLMPR
ncbi:lytic transglycosylase domain-containing protein [Salmonella enterica]|uniref:lytic transglycosylase domain-containing protein n=1 Tax=Salmonella enterica TaxID=28901 RepID=UPI0021D4B0F5|nr:lytic transglycosylase domain-containing protein [Salmonella enterica]